MLNTSDPNAPKGSKATNNPEPTKKHIGNITAIIFVNQSLSKIIPKPNQKQTAIKIVPANNP
ncbi:MAG: hypothetical protein ACOX6N_00010 [Patescibacteria group bacterium]